MQITKICDLYGLGLIWFVAKNILNISKLIILFSKGK